MVSRLCFGSLTIGPLQKNLPLREGAALIAAALDAGVNFVDTAESYQTYPYIKKAIIGRLGARPDIVIASKSYAATWQEMQNSVETACRALGREWVDIFLLHEQTSRLTLMGHKEALNYLVKAKQEGKIRAAGVSTHSIEVVRAASLLEEVDVIHPILNRRGLGIIDGSFEQMVEAVRFAASCGKGIYAMKALGGGHLISEAADALRWTAGIEGVASVAVGMQSMTELMFNCAIFSGRQPSPEMAAELAAKTRRVIVESWCRGCGTCAAHCPAGAISILNGRAKVDAAKCVFCGYCAAWCPDFCLKVL